jgi:hypothetical protein
VLWELSTLEIAQDDNGHEVKLAVVPHCAEVAPRSTPGMGSTPTNPISIGLAGMAIASSLSPQ